MILFLSNSVIFLFKSTTNEIIINGNSLIIAFVVSWGLIDQVLDSNIIRNNTISSIIEWLMLKCFFLRPINVHKNATTNKKEFIRLFKSNVTNKEQSNIYVILFCRPYNNFFKTYLF